MHPVATDDHGKAWLDALGALIRAQRMTAGLSLRELAVRTNVSNAYLSQIERGLHEPSISVLGAIAEALDIPLATLLARAGLLPERGAPLVRDTEAAILGDAALSEPQRIALLSIYRSFVPTRPR